MTARRLPVLVLALAASLCAAPLAGEVLRSPRPVPRLLAPGLELPAEPRMPGGLRPRARPGEVSAPLVLPAPQELAAMPRVDGPAPFSDGSPRPRPRPKELEGPEVMAKEMAPETAQPAPRADRKGSVCGNPAIRGEKLAAIKGKVKGCGLDKPVRVTQVAGLRLSQPATLSCETALALHDWIETQMKPAFGGAEVVELQIAASYICRPRNNKRGAKISEHGRGKAIDISGFVFADGTVWTIARDYNRTIRRAHRGACGIFGTTLGPGSDGYHEDHLHFDVARHRGGPYCR